MSQIPRKPTFPSHVVSKIISRIQQQVDDNVIPVSTGIYTQQKLISQLQAIPKPVLVDYDDPIFYEIVEKNGVCPLACCPLCQKDFSNKNKSVMCQFCSRWSCEECLCFRKRLHPRQKNPNGNRYNICYDCDEKYLSLQFNHTYVENRMLIQTAIVEVSKEIDDLQGTIDELTRKRDSQKEEPKRKLNIRISFLKKEDLDLKKEIKKMGWDVEAQKDKKQKLQHKLVQSYSNLNKAQAMKEQKRRERSTKKHNEEIKEKERQQEQEKKKEQLLREQREQQQKRYEIQKQRELQKQRQQERQKQIQRKRRIVEEERVKEQKRKIFEEQQRKRIEEETPKQEQRRTEQYNKKQQSMLRQKHKQEQIHKNNKHQYQYQYEQTQTKNDHQSIDEQQQEQNQNTADNTFESSPQNNQMYNQFKNYFTQHPLQSEIELQKQQQLQMFDREERETQIQLKKDTKDVQKYEKQMHAKDMEKKRVQILQEAIKRQKEWENSKEDNYPETEVMIPSEKCKCSIF